MVDEAALQIDNEEERLQKARSDNAREKEIQATVQEIQAAMWDAVTKLKGVEKVNPHERLKHYRAEADRARGEANAAHKVAGTTPAVFAPYIAQTVSGQLDTFRQEYVKAKDAEAHPEAYGKDSVPPPAWAEGIKILEAWPHP